MDGKKRFAVLLAMLAASALIVLAGCAQGDGTQGTPDQGADPGADESTQTMTLETVEQWATSKHALVVTRAATEEGCKNCHDGLTFTVTGGGFQPRREDTSPTTGSDDADGAAAEETSERDFTVGTDCRACHMGAGAEIADQGSVDGIPNVQTAQGGLGAVCMACHNGWHPAGKSDGELTAPHYSVQTDMLYGVNTVDPGQESTATQGDMASPHLDVENTCVGCHLAGQPPSHTFRVENFEGCEGDDCHDQDMTDGGTAKEDYDGDGTVEKTTVEIDGLMGTLKAAIESRAGAFESARGQISFARPQRVNDATYAAAYNYIYVEKDGSRGAHNTAYTVDLLTRSIRAMGGTAGGTGGTGSDDGDADSSGSSGGSGSGGGGTGSGDDTGTTETSPTSP